MKGAGRVYEVADVLLADGAAADHAEPQRRWGHDDASSAARPTRPSGECTGATAADAAAVMRTDGVDADAANPMMTSMPMLGNLIHPNSSILWP